MAFLKLFQLLVVCLSQILCIVDVPYKYKIESAHLADGFAFSLATSPGKLVIGAPGNRYKSSGGSVYVGHGVKLTQQVEAGFGRSVDVNDRFMIVSAYFFGEQRVFVYQSELPYTLKATLHVDFDFTLDLKITASNTIVVAGIDQNSGSGSVRVAIYEYDGSASWHLVHKTDGIPSMWLAYFNTYYAPVRPLALTDNIVVVGVPDFDGGQVVVYVKTDRRWAKKQIIEPPQGKTRIFGISLATTGDYLAVSSSEQVHTFHFDHDKGKWLNDCDGEIKALGFVTMEENLLVVNNNGIERGKVCGTVYKLRKPVNGTEDKCPWQEVATLHGEPLKDEEKQGHPTVSVQDGLVYTGRVSIDQEAGFNNITGIVFVHDISKLVEN